MKPHPDEYSVTVVGKFTRLFIHTSTSESTRSTLLRESVDLTKSPRTSHMAPADAMGIEELSDDPHLPGEASPNDPNDTDKVPANVRNSPSNTELPYETSVDSLHSIVE